MNALKNGNYSRHVRVLLDALVQDPMLWDALLTQQRAERRKQRKARITAAGILSLIIEGKPAPLPAPVRDRLGNDPDLFIAAFTNLVRELQQKGVHNQTLNL